MFSNEHKIFIVQAFGRHSSPTKVRQEFLKHYAIKKGRPISMYKLNQFVKVRQHFIQSVSIAPTATKRRKTKRTDAGIEEVRSLVIENRVASLRKPQTTIWKIDGYDLRFKFYRITSQAATSTVLWMAAISVGRYRTENILDGWKIILSAPKTTP